MASTGLRVRQHERRRIALDAELLLGEPYRAQVRLSSASTAPEPFVLPCVLEDVSPGGAGIVVREFVPRLTGGHLRVFSAHAGVLAADNTLVRDVVFQQEIRIRRVVMRSHAPEYALGLAFVDAAPDLPDRVRHLLDSVAAAGEADSA